MITIHGELEPVIFSYRKGKLTGMSERVMMEEAMAKKAHPKNTTKYVVTLTVTTEHPANYPMRKKDVKEWLDKTLPVNTAVGRMGEVVKFRVRAVDED